MKKLILISILLLSILFPFTSNAQCGFDVIRQKQLLDPAFKLQEQENELKIKNFVAPSNITGKSGTILTIPVVVHVLHKGEAIGTGTNISDAQIYSAIDRLNVVYRGLDPSSPIDFEIEFALAQRDPNCNATSGIDRFNATSVSGYSANGVYLQSIGADENTLKDLSRWPETDYFNIWIVSEIDGNNGGFGIQGYANFYNGNAYEGSVMMASVFGYDIGNTNGWNLNSNGDGSTVVHEFGHYFHLYHTFQGDNDDANCPGDLVVGDDSDGCSDTEIHKRHTSTCPTNNDCLGNNPYGLNTRNNYMSYFSCTDRLTNNQKTRVTAAMTGTSIVASKGATAPDGPFSPPLANSCTPQTDVAFGLADYYSGIGKVEIKDMINSSGYPSDDEPSTGTLDESSNCQKLITVDISEVVSIAVTTLFNNGNNIKAYIDYDNSGSFTVAEEIFSKTGIAANSTTSGTFTIPVTATTGTSLRLRVIQDLQAISGPCYNSTYGQAEDYTIYINAAAGSAPVADFSGTPTTLCVGNSVSFSDLSTNTPTSWSWTFTGGTPSSSSVQNPTITYNTPGTYQVQLTATNASGSDGETKVGYITVNAVPSNAGAIAGSISACDNATGVTYSISAVSGATGYTWTVPTGATVASGQGTTNITVDFGTTSGNVAVNPTNSCGNGGQASKTVTVAPCGSAPVANFSSNKTTICLGESINFSDLSTNTPTSWLWSFGDGGSTASQNTTYNYNTPGTYTVTLTATNASGSDDEIKVGYITVNICPTPTIRPAHCGRVMSQVNQQVYSTVIANATKYEFRLIPQGGGDTLNYESCCSFRLNFAWFTGWKYNTTYDVSVRAFVSGSWTMYGASCPITSPSITLPTIRPAHCGRVMSQVNQQVYSTEIANATKYEFRLIPQGGGDTLNYESCCTFRLNFAWFTGWSYNTTYDVSVRAFVESSWTLYGASCPITSPASARLFEGETARTSNNEEESVIEFSTTLTIYPNPNSGEQLNVMMENLTPNTTLLITDIYGKVILNKPLNTDLSQYNVEVKFDNKLTAGFYFITIISEGNRVTEKLIVR